jgi:hypothetical protein
VAATTGSFSGLVTGASFQATGNAISVIGDSLEGFVAASQAFVGAVNRTSGNYLPLINTGSTHTWRVGVTTTGGITYTAQMNANGGLQVPNTVGVGGTTPSTSGAGITFPATQSASTDANTLDDYEEGTWTPIFTTTGTNFTSGGNVGTGRYIKIGKMVTVLVNAVLSGAVSGGTGDVVITGLPFPVSGSGSGIGAFLSGRVTITTSNYYLVTEGGTSRIGISFLVSGANPTSLPASAVNGNGTPYISGTITYFAND